MSDNRQNKAAETKEDNNNGQQVAIMNEQQQNQLENGMKDLLEKILTYMEKFIKTKEDLQAIEGKLSDYDNLHSLLEIIKSIFAHLTFKIDEQLEKVAKQLKSPQSTSSPSEGNADYDQLEKILQKHEADIRFHIRSNQTMKLYQENLQQKLDESEQSRSELLESTKLMISDIKRQNNQLGEQISKLEAENKVLQERVKTSGEKENTLEEKLKNLPFLQEKIQTLERIIKDNNNKNNSHDKYLSGITQLQQQQFQSQYQANTQQQQQQQQQSSNLSSSVLQKDNSLKKMSSAIIVNSNSNSTSSADYELFQKPLKKQQGFQDNSSNLKQQNNYSNPSGISSLLSTHSTSPLKVAERRTHTPTLTAQQNKLKENALKSSYQRFYNNIKGTNNKEDSSSVESLMTAAALLPRKSLPNGVIINGSNYTVSGSGNALDGRGSAGLGSSLSNNYNLHNGSSMHVHLHTNSSNSGNNNNNNNYMNKELKTAPSLPTNHNSSSKNGMMGSLVASTLREKDSKVQTTSGGNSMTNSQNNSFIGNNNNNSSNLNSNSIKNFKPTSSHKRSKSHQVNNKIRGIVGNNNIHSNNGSSNLAVKNITDYSRMSSQDISEIQLTSVGNYK